jgi:hypothetical protein
VDDDPELDDCEDLEQVFAAVDKEKVRRFLCLPLALAPYLTSMFGAS